MPSQPLGDVSVEIDETLRRARDRVENQLSQYRMSAFIAVFVTTSAIWLFIQRDSAPPWPAVFFFGAAVYASAVRWFVRRRGSTATIIYASMCCDVLVMVL